MATPGAQGGRGMPEADREEPSFGGGGCNGYMRKEEIARTQWGSRERTASRDRLRCGPGLSSHWDVLNGTI